MPARSRKPGSSPRVKRVAPPPARRPPVPLALPQDGFAPVTWESVDLSQALVIVGFPSVGLVGSLATAHLISTNAPKQVGAVLSPHFPPSSVVSGGISSSPVRIYLTDLVCGLDGVCDQLCIVHSDIVPKPANIPALAYAVVAWAQDHRARNLVCLEGLTASKPASVPNAEPRVFGVASGPASRESLTKLKVSALEDGLLTGIGGVALYAARAVGLPALCLVAESRKEFPDARGAAKLLEALQPLVPLVHIDERPLLDQAQVLESVYKAQVQQQNAAVKDLSDRADIMYG